MFEKNNIVLADRTKTFFCPFKCDSGPFRTSGDLLQIKKHPHQQPSRKLGTQCISRIHVDQLENGTFSVKYIPSHTGHDIRPTELSYLPLPNSVKEEIATKINLGIRKNY